MPASNGSNQASILNGLGIAAAPDTGALPASAVGSPKPDANQPGNDVVKTAPNNQSPQVGGDEQSNRALVVLKSIASGKLPGVSIPVDAPKLKSDITPDDLVSLGVGMYHPKTKGLSAILFHMPSVPLSTLKVMDAKGTLLKAFPSITRFLSDSGASGAPASGKGASGQGTPPSDAAQDSATGGGGSGGPAGSSTPNASALNLTGAATSAPQVVPVLPRPAGASANRQVASARMKALAGTQPSERPMPGAGSIVNGLSSAPI